MNLHGGLHQINSNVSSYGYHLIFIELLFLGVRSFVWCDIVLDMNSCNFIYGVEPKRTIWFLIGYSV